jgi:hypothetical protein
MSDARKLGLAMFAACLWAASAAVVWADAGDIGAQGREIMNKREKAVIGVKLTMKMRMAAEGKQYQEEESTREIRGTVVDPSGLVVCALSQADPTQMFAGFTGGQEGSNWQVDITAVKLRLADGKEIPAKIVLRDKDLDLAFVRPTEKLTEPLAAVDLADSSPVNVLDEVVVLERLGEVANRAAAATFDRIAAIIQKPRLLYVPGPMGQMSSLGCPVFTLDGKVVGVLVVRALSAAGGEVSDEDMGMMAVILPAADALEVAKQAPAAGAGEGGK